MPANQGAQRGQFEVDVAAVSVQSGKTTLLENRLTVVGGEVRQLALLGDLVFGADLDESLAVRHGEGDVDGVSGRVADPDLVAAGGGAQLRVWGDRELVELGGVDQLDVEGRARGPAGAGERDRRGAGLGLDESGASDRDQ